MNLDDMLGMSISDFCRNGFTDSADNHCAHFVCHVLNVDTGYTCQDHKRGKHPGACLRVQELFSVCPEVGFWGNQPRGTCLVFVTDRANVNIDKHVMRNVPKKHVGIFNNGFIYNYSNIKDIVVKQTPSAFLDRFKTAYGGNQMLYFGSLPFGSKVLNIEEVVPAPEQLPQTSQVQAAGPAFKLRTVPATASRDDYFITYPGQAEFYLARETSYGGRRGLAQPSSKVYGGRYEITDYTDEYGPVAAIMGIIASGESSGYFNRLNSYDRAAFTFGFFQLAAHTPRDNLILLIRQLAAEHSRFQELFPELEIKDGKLHKVSGTNRVSLENEYPRPDKPNELNLKDFMQYLNSDQAKVDDAEISAAARLVHLANSDETFNHLQVNVAAHILMRRMRNTYSTWYGLNGVSDLICAAIADIHHQGRGTKQNVKDALAKANTLKGQLDQLCKIGSEKYPDRCLALRDALVEAQQEGFLGKQVFDRASGLFRPSRGWVA